METRLPAVFPDARMADFDGDGFLDLALISGGGALLLLPGEGDGTFGELIHIDAADPFDRVMSAVVAGDSRAWLLTLGFTPSGSEVRLQSLRLGDDGRWALVDEFIPSSIAVADLDFDGKADVVVVGSSGVAEVHGREPWESPRNDIIEAGGGRAVAVAVGDFDGDAALDIATSGLDDGISVLWGGGRRWVSPGGALPWPQTDPAYGVRRFRRHGDRPARGGR